MKRFVAGMRRQLELLLLALQFFTRVPIPSWVGYSEERLNRSARYFPLIGLFVGIVAAGTYSLTVLLLPQGVAVLLSTVATLLLTGAFHEDGFADVCDGFGGGSTRERVLEIMKDSRIGAYGAIGIGSMLMLKWQSLAALPVTHVAPVLVLAHGLSRLGSCALIWRMSYARENGKAKPLAQGMSHGEYVAALAVIALANAALCWIFNVSVLLSMLAWIAVAMVAGAMGRWFSGRIGGFTGDCLGAVQQVSEVVIYIVFLM